MDYSLLWKAVVIVIGGTFILRIAGRKSLNQMSIAQVVIMIGLGSLIVQPITGKSVWITLIMALLLVMTLVVIELGELKFDWIEGFVSGRSKMVIKDGELQEAELKKLRLTVDQLEMKLRHSQIASIEDVREATMEPNGQLGYILKANLQSATKEDIELLRQEIQSIKYLLKGSQESQGPLESYNNKVADPSLFIEVEKATPKPKSNSHNDLH